METIKHRRRKLRPWVKNLLGINKFILIIAFITVLSGNSTKIEIDSEAMEYSLVRKMEDPDTLLSETDQLTMFQNIIPERVEVSETSEEPQEEETKEEEENVKEPTVEYELSNVGYVNVSGLRVRENPDINSNVVEYLSWGDKIEYSEYDDEWLVIKINDNYSYVSKKYISDTLPNYKSKRVVGDTRKSYMDFKMITSKSSPQYKLQHKYAYTDDTGIRMVDGRYCVALGSYYTHKIGQYVDLVLENGTIIPCIIGDQKDDRDTNASHTIAHDGSATEFIVETKALSGKTRRMGDIGYAQSDWLSNVVEVRIYDIILPL
jgi:hypothetical protein|nr:MAG TPA: SH3 domain protein [Caudoviricetes sp.]